MSSCSLGWCAAEYWPICARGQAIRFVTLGRCPLSIYQRQAISVRLPAPTLEPPPNAYVHPIPQQRRNCPGGRGNAGRRQAERTGFLQGAESLVFYCRTTSASITPRTPRRTCCPYATGGMEQRGGRQRGAGQHRSCCCYAFSNPATCEILTRGFLRFKFKQASSQPVASTKRVLNLAS